MPQTIKKRTKELVAGILILSLLCWFGLIKPALAGDLSNVSDTISDSRPTTPVPTHTIIFTMESGTTIANTETVTVQFTGFTTGATVGVNGDWTVSHDADGAGAYTDLTVTTDYTITQMPVSTADPTATFTFTAAGSTAIGTNKYMKIVFTNGAGKLPNPSAGVKTITIAGTFGDTGVAKVSIISGVTVSVSVAETLSFAIDEESAANCADTIGGTEITSGITATAMPFSTISANTFYYGCQKLTVSTNATDGYTTTVKEIDQLELSDNTTEIADGTCDGTCSETVSTTWTSTADANAGFGYCLEDATGNAAVTADATYWATTAQCNDATPQFKVFPCLEETEAASAVMQSAASLTTADITRVGYRINVSSTQTAGSYTNEIIYVTTPQYD